MPVYPFQCGKCSHTFDDIRTIAQRDAAAKCPKCKGKCTRQIAGLHTDKGYAVEMESEALGVNPDQIPQIQKQFPHHRFNPKTGAMLIGSHQEFKQVLKDIGYRDWNSFN